MPALKNLKEMPPRRRYGLVGLVFAVALSVWAAVERDLFDGLILLTAVVGLGLGVTGRFFPSRPRFQVGFQNSPDPQLLRLVPNWRKRYLDREAIAQEQVDRALETMPERPTQVLSPDLRIGPLIAQAPLASLQAKITGLDEEAFQEFESEVAAYGGDVANWAGRLEAFRDERLKVFKGRLRIEELGSAPADHVRLRLRFPEGFKLASDLPEAEASPDPPKFHPGVLGNFSMKDLTQVQRALPSLPWSDRSEDPKYLIENSEPVVEFELGRINQGDHRDAPIFELRVPGPGSYPVQWEASSSGLGEPATGTLVIECQAAKEGPSITTLDQAETQRERLERL